MSDFVPRRGLRNGHVMTLYAWGRPRRFDRLPPAAERLFAVAPQTRVLAHCHWQPQRAAAPVLLALHGLEGSSQAHYMRGLANKAWAAGFHVVLLNQRNCGGTEHLGPGLYHSGLTEDAAYVLRELAETDGVRDAVVAGYSLGGNLALKLAGNYGDAAPSSLRAVCAVSPVMDLARCVDALERPQNVVYQWNFVRGLKGRMRRKEQLHPGRFPLEPLARIRSVREFDEAYTAPHFGFRDASDYYHRASALRVVDRIRVPTLIITAEDDPFVPVAPFRDPLVAGNAQIRLMITRHGGHCGFIADPVDGDDGYWAERQVVRFAAERVGAANGSPAATRAGALRLTPADPASAAR
jgi:predicted alpha/beta-fold hydrolase